MGGIGKAIKKFVNKIVKVWKKLDPLTFKVLDKLGLRSQSRYRRKDGKLRKHLILVQNLLLLSLLHQ